MVYRDYRRQFMKYESSLYLSQAKTNKKKKQKQNFFLFMFPGIDHGSMDISIISGKSMGFMEIHEEI